MTEGGFIGMDLASSPASPTACIGLGADLSLSFVGLLRHDADLVALVVSEKPSLTAIDAPLTLPQGQCCLEESCGCQPQHGPGRECERELAKMGIPCYFTTKRSIIKKMACRGLALRKTLESRGFPVIEIYPYASKVLLWGRPIPSKSKPGGLAFLRAKLAELVPGLSAYTADFSHHLGDAAVAAYTAYLHSRGETEQLGTLEEGVISIPRRPGASLG